MMDQMQTDAGRCVQSVFRNAMSARLYGRWRDPQACSVLMWDIVGSFPTALDLASWIPTAKW